MARKLGYRHPSRPARATGQPDTPANAPGSFAVRAFTHHPGISWSAIAAIAAVLTFASPYLNSMLGLIETQYAAKEREQTVRSDLNAKMDAMKADFKNDVAAIYVEIGKIKAELKQHEEQDARSSAGVTQTLLENRVYVARNKINDCNIQRQKSKTGMTILEQNACDQYNAEFTEAKRRYENAVDNAQKTWRGQ